MRSTSILFCIILSSKVILSVDAITVVNVPHESTADGDYGEDDFSVKCGNIPGNLRFDCHPEDGASQLACTDRGCCWDPVNDEKFGKDSSFIRGRLDEPFCFYPENWPGYEFVNSSRDGDDFSGFLTRRVNSFYRNDVSLVKITATSLTDSILRVKVRQEI